jgi:hypothetical protein
MLGARRTDGIRSSVDVEWLVDTGADLTTVRRGIGRLFRYRRVVAASASPTTGGKGILVVTGLETEFSAVDAFGATSTLVSTQHVGVKSNNAGSDLLGMIQLADQSAMVMWSPHTKKGELRI